MNSILNMSVSGDCSNRNFKLNLVLEELGKPRTSKTDEFPGKKTEGGGGHFQSKNLYRKIWTFKQGYLTMKLIQRGPVRHPFKKFAT